MAKTRMLKTDLRTSEKVASWPIELRYFWVLLWGYVDDHGKGKDNPLLIKADCFPLDPEITGDTIDVWLDHLADSGVIVRYEVDGVRLVKIVHWAEHQKPQHPTPDVLPNPDAPGARSRSPHEGRMNGSRAPHAPLTPGFELGLSGVEPRGADAHATEPPLFCPSHPQGSNGSNCGPCGDQRRIHDKWTRDLLNNKPEEETKSSRPPAWDTTTHCEHGRRRGACDICVYEEKRAAVVHGQFGGAA